MRRRRAKVEAFEWLAPGAQAGTFAPRTQVARSPSAPLRWARWQWERSRSVDWS